MNDGELDEDRLTSIRMGKLNAMEKRLSELESALVEIRDHPHCHWQDDPLLIEADRECGEGLGSISGHRCCAEIARRALEKK